MNRKFFLRRYSPTVCEQSSRTVQMYSNMYSRVRGGGGRRRGARLPRPQPGLAGNCTSVNISRTKFTNFWWILPLSLYTEAPFMVNCYESVPLPIFSNKFSSFLPCLERPGAVQPVRNSQPARPNTQHDTSQPTTRHLPMCTELLPASTEISLGYVVASPSTSSSWPTNFFSSLYYFVNQHCYSANCDKYIYILFYSMYRAITWLKCSLTNFY
jgi:hypothetical protein